MRVNKAYLDRVLRHYEDALMHQFPSRLPTPAALVMMQRFLEEFKMGKLRMGETDPVWRVPVIVSCGPNQRPIVSMHPQADVDFI